MQIKVIPIESAENKKNRAEPRRARRDLISVKDGVQISWFSYFIMVKSGEPTWLKLQPNCR
jgi:hypothetical protein